MVISRPELQAFVNACEYLLAMTIEPPLAPEERELMMHYLRELSHKFADQPLRVVDPAA